MPIYTKQTMKEALIAKLRRHFGREVNEANDMHLFQASALVLRDILTEQRHANGHNTSIQDKRQVHYLSLEFLLGRSLLKNACNLDVLTPLEEALSDFGHPLSEILDTEPDAGLGNGGLGRLAACYMDSMTTLGIPATGYSICYELGIFRQKIIDGQQVELADRWLDAGGVWLIPKMDEVEEVHFGGTVEECWEDGRLRIVLRDPTTVLAIPKDLRISGYHTSHVNTLRLWDAKSPVPVDMSLYSRGDYLKAVEQQAMAEVIAKVLYPEDNHYEGKSLRLKQQYFFVSATVQSITRKHRTQYGTLRNFHEKHVIQINDTHPALVIPELMRIFLDVEGYDWETAWEITTQTVAYTNHTVLAEALERWPQNLVETLLPRVFSILCEINRRFCGAVHAFFHGDPSKEQEMAIVWNQEIRMANLCVAACFAINGVSALHSRILTENTFQNAYRMMPQKFLNVTNGIDHRRWLAQANPRLHALICSLTGSDGYLLLPNQLKELERFCDDLSVLEELRQIKRQNKLEFTAFAKQEYGISLNPDAIFDVQVKRLHEYKRQLLNVLHILSLYHRIQTDPHFDMVPRTFLFGAKAAPGYHVAKQIIRLISSVSAQINKDPRCKDKLQVFFLENYRVSLAERLIPASEVSEQISTAGKEASGTGNMKFMMNGALTIGTLDGANVEMHDAIGSDNMFLFGLTADEISQVKAQGYNPYIYYNHNDLLKCVLDQISTGFDDGVSYSELVNRLLLGNGSADEYMLLADFDAYVKAHQRVEATYRIPRQWNQMALHNIAQSGIFSADRSIRTYAGSIWHIPVVERTREP